MRNGGAPKRKKVTYPETDTDPQSQQSTSHQHIADPDSMSSAGTEFITELAAETLMGNIPAILTGLPGPAGMLIRML